MNILLKLKAIQNVAFAKSLTSQRKIIAEGKKKKKNPLAVRPVVADENIKDSFKKWRGLAVSFIPNSSIITFQKKSLSKQDLIDNRRKNISCRALVVVYFISHPGVKFLFYTFIYLLIIIISAS